MSPASTAASPAGVPVLDPGVTEEYATAMAARIASRFAMTAPVEAYDFPQKGNINQHTFLIQSGRPPACREYLLQRINQQVFTRPRNTMAAMLAVLDAQREGLARRPLPSGWEWETIQLVPTRDGKPYLEATGRRGTTWWRMMVKIPPRLPGHPGLLRPVQLRPPREPLAGRCRRAPPGG